MKIFSLSQIYSCFVVKVLFDWDLPTQIKINLCLNCKNVKTYKQGYLMITQKNKYNKHLSCMDLLYIYTRETRKKFCIGKMFSHWALVSMKIMSASMWRWWEEAADRYEAWSWALRNFALWLGSDIIPYIHNVK